VGLVRVGIFGTGNVDQALARGLAKTQNEVRFGSRDPERVKGPRGAKVEPQRQVADLAETLILAMPFSAIKQTVEALGPGARRRKVVVDPTNAISPSMGLALGFSTSGAEELAKLAPETQIVEAFNTVFSQNMASSEVAGEVLTLPVPGDGARAKEAVMRLGREIGFDVIDAGPLTAARYLEPMGVHLISLGYGQKLGTGIGHKLVRERK
jgi:hypothetical protein